MYNKINKINKTISFDMYRHMGIYGTVFRQLYLYTPFFILVSGRCDQASHG
jgi:hypothetical protein